MKTGRVVHEHDPSKKEYADYVYDPLHKLHFAEFSGLGTFGHYVLKTTYFIMALLTCFVIITGVLIWLEARKKNNIPERKRKFNKAVGNIYLAICLSMFPVTAGSFIVSKLLPANAERELILNTAYFGSWLLLSIFFAIKGNNSFTNKCTLLSTGIIGCFVPVINGLVSGKWIWRSIHNDSYSFTVDLVWILISATAFFVTIKLRQRTNNTKQ